LKTHSAAEKQGLRSRQEEIPPRGRRNKQTRCRPEPGYATWVPGYPSRPGRGVSALAARVANHHPHPALSIPPQKLGAQKLGAQKLGAPCPAFGTWDTTTLNPPSPKKRVGETREAPVPLFPIPYPLLPAAKTPPPVPPPAPLAANPSAARASARSSP